jgi:hypothetical protein
MSMYDPLRDFLSVVEGRSVTLRLEEIEEILGCPLPGSSRKRRPYWGNQVDTSNRRWARAWTEAGWRVAPGGVTQVGVGEARRVVAVTFERTGSGGRSSARSPSRTALSGETPRRLADSAGPEPASPAGADLGLVMVSACSKAKSVRHARELTKEDFADPPRFARRERELANERRPARAMYTGEEHRRVSRAVETLRGVLGAGAVGHVIVSAGYGVIGAEHPIVPYNVTFATMRPTEVDAWSAYLKIPEELSRRIVGWQLVLFALGDKYMRAIRPCSRQTEDGQHFVYLAAGDWPSRLGGRPRVTVLDAGNAAARWGRRPQTRKGRMLERFADSAVTDPAVIDRLREYDGSLTLAQLVGAEE